MKKSILKRAKENNLLCTREMPYGAQIFIRNLQATEGIFDNISEPKEKKKLSKLKNSLSNNVSIIENLRRDHEFLREQKLREFITTKSAPLEY